jgi:hypothetical protein
MIHREKPDTHNWSSPIIFNLRIEYISHSQTKCLLVKSCRLVVSISVIHQTFQSDMNESLNRQGSSGTHAVDHCGACLGRIVALKAAWILYRQKRGVYFLYRRSLQERLLLETSNDARSENTRNRD